MAVSLNAPEHKVAEILDGELFLSPMLAPRDCVVHSRLLGTLGRALDDGNGGGGGWWILPKPEVHLGEDVVVPDIGGWRREGEPFFEAHEVEEIQRALEALDRANDRLATAV